MGKVNVDDLKSGMVLDSDLLDPKGRFLLGKGAVLQDKNIQTLKIWGITEADIRGLNREKAAEDTMPQISPEIMKKSEDYAAFLFQCSNSDHEAIRELKRLRILSLAKKLSAGEKLPEIDVFKRIADLEEISPRREKLLSIDDLLSNAQLTSFPDIYYRITRILNDPDSSAYQLAEVISKDTSLSTKLLKLANSVFYGLPAKVDSVTRAITVIGLNEIGTLAMGVVAIRFFKGIPQKLVNMKDFWVHSISCGTLASILVRNKTDLAEERYFVAGMLHDIGRLVIAMAMPEHTKQAILEAQKRLIPLHSAEKEILGFDHAEIAALLLEKWDLPEELIHMVEFHHHPLVAPNLLDASIIHFANLTTIACQFGSSGEIFVPSLADKAWNLISASTSVLAPAISQTERLVKEIVKDFIDE